MIEITLETSSISKYTSLLFAAQCYTESGCSQSVKDGYCQMLSCPDEYPDCRGTGEEALRQNILAAASHLADKLKYLSAVKDEFSEANFLKLLIFSYNRGEGTVLGTEITRNINGIKTKVHLNGTMDYIDRGFDLRESMIRSCYEFYDWGLYYGCGGLNKADCCKDIGGAAYVDTVLGNYLSFCSKV